ncbi:MAG: thiamine diphosphokinase [Lachnospiraceae bacterium]|nr:thiamine diphosphokinase [Lachnospiraceae bacterium]
MGICYIVAAMKTEYRIDKNPEDFVIAADGGYAQEFGCRPDAVIGDFDSLGYVPKGANVQVYPKQKDDTDMMLAVKLGLEKGYTDFILIGGLGGRLDHTLANIQTLAYLAMRGAKGVLCSDEADVYLLSGEATGQESALSVLCFPADTKGIFSVFSYGRQAEDVCIRGAEYEVEHACLTDDFPLGVSNSFVGSEVTVSVGRGRLLVVRQKQADAK